MSAFFPVAVLVQKVGPYHHARFDTWARSRAGVVSVIEFRPDDPVYAWKPVVASGTYARHVSRCRKELVDSLERLQPRVVVTVGYADPEVHQAVAWAQNRAVPLVTCSDSTYADEPRVWIREALKRQVLRPFATGLAAGVRSRDYLAHLGLPADRIFQPWDVVDNRYFADGAAAARRNPESVRRRWNLPAQYFLCVARFVPKKNLQTLIEAYSLYASRAGSFAWSLVLSGAGPLEPQLRAVAVAGGQSARIYFPGFLQYPDLPACYGLAGALVLPSWSDQWGLVVNEAMAAGLPVLVSNRCGCGPDLVRPGENGDLFDPGSVGALAAKLEATALLSPGQLQTMGQRSQEIVAAFSPEAFARGLEAAVAGAREHRPQRPSWLGRWLSARLARRPVPRT